MRSLCLQTVCGFWVLMLESITGLSASLPFAPFLYLMIHHHKQKHHSPWRNMAIMNKRLQWMFLHRESEETLCLLSAWMLASCASVGIISQSLVCMSHLNHSLRCQHKYHSPFTILGEMTVTSEHPVSRVPSWTAWQSDLQPALLCRL